MINVQTVPQVSTSINFPKTKKWMFFDLILKRYHPRDPGTITALLTQEEQRCQIKAPPSELTDWLIPSSSILATLHPAWIVDTLKTFEDKRRASILSALPESLCTQVCHLGQWPEPALHVRPAFTHHILRDLVATLQGSTYLPLSALPKSPLSPLLDLTLEQLAGVVDCMGLRDLAEVVRGIVDKKFLHSIYSCLKPQDQKLLRFYIQQKERIKSTPLMLKTWNGSKEALRLLYHERGLLRMARALQGQNEGFLWHLLHRFSPPEAENMKRQFQHLKPHAEVTALLTQQLLGILEFLKRQTLHDTT